MQLSKLYSDKVEKSPFNQLVAEVQPKSSQEDYVQQFMKANT